MIVPKSEDGHILLSSPGPNRTQVVSEFKIRNQDMHISISGQINLPIIEALGLVYEMRSALEEVIWRRSEGCAQERKQNP